MFGFFKAKKKNENEVVIMKIKHWQGYGSVSAKKISEKTFTTDYGEKGKSMIIHVSGNHECGLRHNDPYDVFRWLLRRFDRSLENSDYRCIISIETHEGIEDGEEYCDYTISYKIPA